MVIDAILRPTVEIKGAFMWVHWLDGTTNMVYFCSDNNKQQNH